MSAVEVMVQGEHAVLLPTERATVRAEVSLEAGSAQAALADARFVVG